MHDGTSVITLIQVIDFQSAIALEVSLLAHLDVVFEDLNVYVPKIIYSSEQFILRDSLVKLPRSGLQWISFLRTFDCFTLNLKLYSYA